MDGSAKVERIESAGLAALVSRVPRAEFGEEPLRRNLNDLPWLERIARAHEAVLDRALAETTIVPLRVCTLYESEERVRRMLAQEGRAFEEALDHLTGREEWGAKVLLDPERLRDEALNRTHGADAVEETLGASREGGAYMLRRRLEREARESARSLAAEVAADVHARLQDCALDAVTRPPQNRDLSGHEGEMVLNAAYLVEATGVEQLREVAANAEAEHQALGARVELSGPWPPYNFVPGAGTVAIA